jgi:glucose-6-phosphate isomerase
MINFILEPRLSSKTQVEKASLAKSKLYNRSELGFLELCENSSHYELAFKEAKRIKAKSKKQIILGMGGSSLGGETLTNAFSPYQNQVEFWNSIDHVGLKDRFNKISAPAETHWIVISKSGRTLETLSLLNFVNDELTNRGLNLNDQLTIITEDKASPLRDYCLEYNIDFIPHPMNVGGRFSVFSIVGLLPAALIGVDLKKLISGANKSKHDSDFPERLAVNILESSDRKESVSIFWPYDNRLENFARWAQQLWSESLGKKLTQNGEKAKSVGLPIYCLGSREQHSVLQQIIDGDKDKFLIFLSEETDNHQAPKIKNLFPSLNYLNNKSMWDINHAEVHSCVEALQKRELNILHMTYKEFNEEVLGFLLMSYQIAIGIVGEVLNINAFNQPGVELGKKIAIDRLSQ